MLAVDGGGVRGIIPALVLAELERRTGRPVADLFDFMAGTSSGAITALGLARPGPDGRPARSALEAVSHYEEEGHELFTSSTWHRLRGASGLIEAKYSLEGVEQMLHRNFGDAMLSDALVNVMVTSYELEQATPFFFKSHRARVDPQRDYPMKVVIRATTSAPTFFQPLRLKGPDGVARTLVDGGVFANNPAMCAYAELRKRWPDAEIAALVSIGTGRPSRALHFSDVRTWGLAQWVRPLLGMTSDGVNMSIDHQLRHLLPRECYFRFQAEVEPIHSHMDDPSPATFASLRDSAARLIEERSADFDVVCELLQAAQ